MSDSMDVSMDRIVEGAHQLLQSIHPSQPESRDNRCLSDMIRETRKMVEDYENFKEPTEEVLLNAERIIGGNKGETTSSLRSYMGLGEDLRLNAPTSKDANADAAPACSLEVELRDVLKQSVFEVMMSAFGSVTERHETLIEAHAREEWRMIKEGAAAETRETGGTVGIKRREASGIMNSSTREFSGSAGSGLTAEQLAYVNVLVSSVLGSTGGQAQMPILLHGFAAAVESSECQLPRELWFLFRHLVSGLLEGSSGAGQKRSYWRTTGDADALVVKCSKQYLEREFWKKTRQFWMDAPGKGYESLKKIPENMRHRMSAIVDVTRRHLIQKAPLGIQVDSRYSVEGVPVWALIYFSLRAGATDAAAGFVDVSGCARNPLGRAILELAKSSTGGLSEESEEVLHSLYNSESECDPFRLALFAVLSGIRISNGTEDLDNILCSGLDDIFWFRLSQIRTIDTTSASTLSRSSLSVGELRKILLSIGSSEQQSLNETLMDPSIMHHLQASGSDGFLWFKAFALLGLYENAVERIFYSASSLFPAAFHVLVALNQLELLNEIPVQTNPSFGSAFVESTVALESIEVNFPRAVIIYVDSLRLSCHYLPSASLLECILYLSLLKTYPDPEKQYSCMFHAETAKMLLESGEYEACLKLLYQEGLDPSSQRTGLLLYLQSHLEDLWPILGKTLEEKGELEEALKVYAFVRHRENTIRTMKAILARAFHQGLNVHRLLQIEQRVQQALRMSAGSSSRLGDVSWLSGGGLAQESLGLFIHTLHFLQLCDEDMPQARTLLSNAKLVPLKAEEISSCIDFVRSHAVDLKNILPALVPKLRAYFQENFSRIAAAPLGASLTTNDELKMDLTVFLEWATRLPDAVMTEKIREHLRPLQKLASTN